MSKWYAGIGSRKVSDSIKDMMRGIAQLSSNNGWILRSGGAGGSDTAFETGCDQANGLKEIFLPWGDFNGRKSELYPPSVKASILAREIHPVFNNLTEKAKLLVARNMHQILGAQLNDPVKCVVCWTPDGCETFLQYKKTTGGTGTAIALADINNIPVFNLRNKDRYRDAVEFLMNN